MIEKIKNLKLEKPDDFEDREWAEVLSRRNRLLSISDWTQATDVCLLPSNRLEWIIWRDKLRNINRRNYTDREIAKAAIRDLENDRPLVQHSEDNSPFNFIVDLSSVQNSKTDLSKLLTNIKTELAASFIGMCGISFDLLVKEAIDFTVENGTLENYQVLHEFFSMSETSTVEEYCDSILKKYADLKKFIIELEVASIELRKLIAACETLDSIKLILDNIHGYRYRFANVLQSAQSI